MKIFFNKILIVTVTALTIATLSSCEKEGDSYNISSVTILPKFTYDKVAFIPAGGTFTPAAIATEGDKELEITVKGDVDMNTIGGYDVIYETQNSDGFKISASQTVMIYDPNTNPAALEGDYSGDVIRNGGEAYSGNTVTLTKVPDHNVYAISDWIAGFYADGRDYGDVYKFPGYVQINGANEVVHLSMSNPWGDPFDGVVGTYDPGTGTISYTASWLGIYDFVVTLTK